MQLQDVATRPDRRSRGRRGCARRDRPDAGPG
jgi:hypothetical protein